MQVDDVVVSNQEALGKLLVSRWEQACAVTDRLEDINVGWAVGESEHFKKDRGFAVTRFFGGAQFHLIWSEKILGQPLSRVDAIICHEIGHIADYGLLFIEDYLKEALPERMDTVVVPPESQRERRADCLAYLLFDVMIRYDDEDVQTLDPSGVAPRPEHLGL